MNQRDTLLIVDDQEINRAILRSMFEEEFNILEAENGERALLLLQQYQRQIAVVLLDLVMPEKDGYAVMEEMGRGDFFSQIPVIVITSDDSAESEVHSFDLGASDIVMKPFEPHVIRRRVKNIVELYRHKLHLEDLVEEQSASLRESNSIMIDALSSVIEYRSLESGQHIRRIRSFTKILLTNVAQSYQEYDLDNHKIDLITDASSMHDIGKIAIPDVILNKPGRLTPEEFEIMKTHTTKGCEILSGLDRMPDKEYLQYAYNICRYHHERWDGQGYPDGLKGENIPICAQVVAVADCYDALTTNRVYKDAIAQDEAFTMILNGKCGAFSPRLLECFKNVRDAFAQLSREYADGRPLNSAKPDLQLATTNLTLQEKNTLEQGQLKFFALLRYLDSTVIEVDCAQGTYQLLYMAEDTFAPLRSSNRFEQSMRSFITQMVHPDEQSRALKLFGSYLQTFFEEGLLKSGQKYRVLDYNTGTYHWYKASMLRVDIENPRQKRLLVIWQRAEASHPQQMFSLQDFGHNPIYNSLLEGAFKSYNDRWYTFLYFNTGFSELTGYTAVDIQTLFHNRLLEMVYKPDQTQLVHSVRTQIKVGNVFTGEYRIRRKDGRLIWVLERSVLASEPDGTEYFYSVLVDITKSKEAEEQLRLSVEWHQIILEQTNEIIFEWDIAADTLSFSSNWEEKYGYHPITKHASTLLPTVSHIHPSDTKNVMELISSVRAGVPYKEVQFRLAESSGRYRWCRIRATTQFDGNRKPFKAVGIIADIDEEKRAAQKLIDQAERDILTKLYNKEAGRKRIEWYIDHCDPTSRGVLFIIDIDDFKEINDGFGHMFGDAVLTQLASEFSSLFQEDDILSRIGGDEFLAFIPTITSRQQAQKRAQKLIDTIQVMLQDRLEDTRLSCSIGIAFFPDGGKDFSTLFQNADLALYAAKAAGKNRYEIYDSQSISWTFGRTKKFYPARTQLDSESKSESNFNSLIGSVFQRLYETNNFEKAVNSILEMIGRMFNVSRAYIFENASNEDYMNNTFEWCNDGICSEMEHLQNYPYCELGEDYRSHFEENGIFYCTNLKKLPSAQRQCLEPQGVLSLLQCAIMDQGRFCGFVGFDDCMIHRLWTQDQIDVLIFVSRLLSIFLIKKRAQDRLEAHIDELRSILDQQDNCIFVVEPESYRIQYMNARVRKQAPGVQENALCYQAFFGKDAPCESCPMKRLLQSGGEALDASVLTEAQRAEVQVSIIQLGNTKGCMLSFHSKQDCQEADSVNP